MRLEDRRLNFRRHVGRNALILLAIFLWPHAVRADYSYYCPKGNAAIVANTRYVAGKVVMAFPLAPNPSLPSSRLFSPLLEWRLSDCSNRQFLCFDADDAKTHLVRRVFIPRRPKVGEIYQYGTAKAFVIGSGSPSKVPTVQVVVSQELGGAAVALKLTLREGLGVIYIDGLNFWDTLDYKNGETCVLESGTGFFSSVEVTIPPPEKVEDF